MKGRRQKSPLEKRERGNVLVALAVTMSMLFALLAFGVDAVMVIAQKMQQENALNLTRETIMSPTITLEAKNSEDPGALISRTLAQALRKQGYSGAVEVWFHEVGRSEGELPENKRIYAYELAVKDLCEPAFSRIFGIKEIPVASSLVTSSMPYAEFRAWRPRAARSGMFRLEANKPADHIVFTTVSLSGMPEDLRKEVATCIDDINKPPTKK
ncbi:MAG: hypothetical protein RR362_00275 [Raoultibacter sp.]